MCFNIHMLQNMQHMNVISSKNDSFGKCWFSSSRTVLAFKKSSAEYTELNVCHKESTIYNL